MSWLVTSAEMRALDRAAIEDLKIPSLVLMESAGRAVARAAQRMLAGAPGPVIALVGVGNNGADAVVAARALAGRGFSVQLWTLGREASRSAELRTQLEISDRLSIPRQQLHAAALPKLSAALEPGALVIDGLFGTGLSRPVEGLWAAAIELVNAQPIPVLSVDIASGLDADRGGVLGAAIHAEETVCFQLPKLGQLLYPGRKLSGALVVADIGIPPPERLGVAPGAALVDPALLLELSAPREPDTHKGSYGRLLLLAGEPERPGAALLAGRAALAAGAGLVTLGAGSDTIERLAPALAALMGRSLGRGWRIDPDLAVEAAESASAVVIGPSLAPDAFTRAVIDALVKTRAPLLIDAGGLGALGAEPERVFGRAAPTVLSPHPGEAARLLGRSAQELQADRPAAARELAAKSGAEVVLKGASTVIASPEGGLSVVAAGNPGMATAGAGDVLSGVIGALLAEGRSAGFAARAGALWHAVAGDVAVAELGERGLTAPVLIEALPAALRAAPDPVLPEL